MQAKRIIWSIRLHGNQTAQLNRWRQDCNRLFRKAGFDASEQEIQGSLLPLRPMELVLGSVPPAQAISEWARPGHPWRGPSPAIRSAALPQVKLEDLEIAGSEAAIHIGSPNSWQNLLELLASEFPDFAAAITSGQGQVAPPRLYLGSWIEAGRECHIPAAAAEILYRQWEGLRAKTPRLGGLVLCSSEQTSYPKDDSSKGYSFYANMLYEAPLRVFTEQKK